MLSEGGDQGGEGGAVTADAEICRSGIKEAERFGGAAGADEAVEGCAEGEGADCATELGEEIVDGLEVIATAEEVDEEREGLIGGGEGAMADDPAVEVDGGAASGAGEVEDLSKEPRVEADIREVKGKVAGQVEDRGRRIGRGGELDEIGRDGAGKVGVGDGGC